MLVNDEIFDMSTMTVVARGLRFPEGPVALEDGSVLVSELDGALARVTADGALTRYPCGGGANGAALGPDGAVYIANNGGAIVGEVDGLSAVTGRPPENENFDNGSIQRLRLDTGEVETVHTHVDGEHLGWLNDIVFDTSGSFYFVDTSMGKLCYADPDGVRIECLEGGLEKPNGAALSPDGEQLYVSQTTGDVLVWDVESAGRVANKRVLFRDVEGHRWDGMAVDGAGNLCIANLGASGVSVVSPEGEELARLVTPEYDHYVTNICFGGPSLSTAYICSAAHGLLYAVEWPWKGLRLNFG